jgi:hypothetical protein
LKFWKIEVPHCKRKSVKFCSVPERSFENLLQSSYSHEPHCKTSRDMMVYFMLSQLPAVAVFDLIYLIRIIQHCLANILKSMGAKSPA